MKVSFLAYTQWKVFEREDLYNDPSFDSNSLWRLEEAPANVPVVSGLHNSSSPYFDSYQEMLQRQKYQQMHAYTADNWARDRQYFTKPFSATNVASNFQQTNNSSVAHYNSRSFWREFKRIYFQELLRFTMNKATFFTLIFSFMFLGCIFFLMGFITASNIYNHNRHSSIEDVKKHMPSEQALLQGRPAKIANMGQNIMSAAPRAFHMQNGVRMASNTRQPSQYVQQQINAHQPNYR